jgi:hypothetical protein
MCKDLSGASKAMRKCYKFKQAKILARFEKEQAALTNMSNNTANK